MLVQKFLVMSSRWGNYQNFEIFELTQEDFRVNCALQTLWLLLANWLRKFCEPSIHLCPSLIRERKQIHRTWKRQSVPGPEPTSIFFGNQSDLLQHGRHVMFTRWTQKYGKVFGYYEGPQPVLVVSDPDMAKEILVKQFVNFPLRHRMLENSDDKYANVIETYGKRWKRIRSNTVSTFTSSKIKVMTPLLNESIKKLTNKLKQRLQHDHDFNILKDCQSFTLDVIASAIFSFECDAYSDKNVFLLKLDELFRSLDVPSLPMHKKCFFAAFKIFPSLLNFVKCFNPRVAALKDEWFLKLAKKVIMERQSSGEVKNDYIDLMLKANSAEDAGRKPDHDADIETKSKFLTMEEMQSTIFIFLAAGYETTATTLAIIAYHLALHPGVQKKLQQEIDEFFLKGSAVIDIQTTEKLQYLDMVFCEVSRLGSVAPLALHRDCKHSTNVGYIFIPEGAKVAVNMLDIHMNEDLWGPEPVDEFVPERFLPHRKEQRHSMAYLPFGAGPKNCIAMRFAVFEVKSALINMLQRFTVVPGERTQVPLQYNSDGLRTPPEGIFVKLLKRH